MKTEWALRHIKTGVIRLMRDRADAENEVRFGTDLRVVFREFGEWILPPRAEGTERPTRIDEVVFTAEVDGKVLRVGLPVQTCDDHWPDGEPDDFTSEAPHVWSTNSYHPGERAVCLGKGS